MLTIAGAGPGNPKYLTVEVKEKIENAECVLAFGRISKTLESIRKDIVKINKVNDIIMEIEKNKEKEILVLASGDPNFYGIINYLKRNNLMIKEVLPGLSSFQYMMSKIEEPWQDANLFSMHGREYSLENVRKYKLSVCLTDRINTPSKISKELKKIGIKGEIIAGYNLSYEDEKIEKVLIGEDLTDYTSLAIVVIKNEMD